MKRIEETFEEKLLECYKHTQKINDAKEFLKDSMPLDEKKYLQIDKIQSSFIDQMVYRFSKLQDTMGESIFRGVLILGKEEVKTKTFIDILNRIEELEIVQKDDWLKLRELRNDIAHEYSFNTNEVVDNINQIYYKSEQLIMIYEKVKNFVEKRFKLG